MFNSVIESNRQYYTIRYTIDYNRVIDPDAPYTIFTAGIIQSTGTNTATYLRHEVNVYIYWDRSHLPDAPSVSFKYDSAADKMVLFGADSTMEYRQRYSAADSWQPCTDEPMYFDFADTSNRNFLVRYSKTDTQEASQVQQVLLPGKPGAPSPTYNSTTETISGLSNTMEIQFGNGSYEPITGTTLEVSDVIDTIADGETLPVNVRLKGTVTRPSGLPKKITLYPRADAPTSVVFDPVSLTLTGTSSTMQYRADTKTSWTSAGTSVNLITYASGERDVTVYVRTKPTSKSAASKPIEIVIPKLLEGPTGVVEYDKERISGLASGAYQYSLNGTSWKNFDVTDGTWSLTSLITTSARTIYLRNAATSTTPITASTVFQIPRRPVAPSTPKFIYNDANNPDRIIFSGLTTDMEYRKSTDTDWTDVPASGLVYDPQTTSVVYYVRTKATDETWASANKSVTMAAMPKAPTLYYSSTTESLTKLGTAYEISFNNGEFIGLTSSTYNLSAEIDKIPPNGTLVVRVRRKATATAPAGQIATKTISARETAAADIPDLEDGFITAPEEIAPPVTNPENEGNPVIAPEVEGIPETTPEVEDTPETTPEVEDTPETTPEAEDTPETTPEVEDTPETTPEAEDTPKTTPEV